MTTERKIPTENEKRTERVRFTAKITAVIVPETGETGELTKEIHSRWCDSERDYLTRDGEGNTHERLVNDEIHGLRKWGVENFTVEWTKETEETIITTRTEVSITSQPTSTQFYRDGKLQ